MLRRVSYCHYNSVSTTNILYTEFELTAEELEEERQDAAVRIIQRAYRGKRALQLLKQLVRANYVKIRDPEFENSFLYKNKTTGELIRTYRGDVYIHIIGWALYH